MDLLQRLQQTFIRIHPQEAARYLELVPPKEAGEILSTIEIEDCAALMEFFLPGPAAEVIKALPQEKGSAIVAALTPSSARSVLRFLDPHLQADILDNLEPTFGTFLRRTLKYPEHTAGALADPRVLTLPRDITVREALSRISVEGRQAIYYLYVLDRDSTLCGVLLMKELLAADPRSLIETMMTSKVTAVPADVSSQDLLSHSAWQVFDSLPVVEKGKYFLGALRHRILKRDTELQPDDRQGQFLSDGLLQLWEFYSISGIEIMTSFAQILNVTADQPSADIEKETP